MHNAGYVTGYIGKWHLGSNRGRLSDGRVTERNERRPVPPHRRGGYRDVWLAADALEHTSSAYGGHVFDENGNQIELEGYRVDALTDLAIDRIAALPHNRPFFMWISFLEPHHQNDRLRVIGPRGQATAFRDFDVPGDLLRWRGDWRWNYAEYLAACANIDANLGRLVEALDQRGELDNTVIIYTSDHGSHFRTRNLEYKRSCHDASLRIPLAAAGPGFAPSERRSELVSVLDLFPTVAAAADVSSGVELDGEALQTPIDRDDLLVQISESQIGRALRTERFTLGARARLGHPLNGHRKAAPSDTSSRTCMTTSRTHTNRPIWSTARCTGRSEPNSQHAFASASPRSKAPHPK